MNLFIDDERNPEDVTWIQYSINDWIILRNYKSVIDFITQNGLPENISFDNDLGEEKEGYDIALFIINYCLDNNLKSPSIYIHSQNPIARDRIFSLFSNFNEFTENS